LHTFLQILSITIFKKIEFTKAVADSPIRGISTMFDDQRNLLNRLADTADSKKPLIPSKKRAAWTLFQVIIPNCRVAVRPLLVATDNRFAVHVLL
jgi:hypothetical protein